MSYYIPGFVAALYQTLWFRSGSASDIHLGELLMDDNMVTPSQAIEDFIQAPESQNFVLPVIRLYQGFFNRTPDIPGLSAWVNALRDGTTNLTQMAQAFAASPEFANLYGANPDPVSFVTSLYSNLLGRPPELASLNIWVNDLSSGALSLAQVAQDIIQSPEAINHLSVGAEEWLTAAAMTAESSPTPAYPAIIPIAVSLSGNGSLLTTGPDVLFGGDIFGTIDGPAPTLQGFDIIAGGTSIIGTNSLGILSMGNSSSRDVLPSGLIITNIQSIGLTTPGNAGQGPAAPFDLSIFPGVETFTINTAGPSGDFIKISSSTDLTDTSKGAGGVTVTGGHDVTVTANGDVTSGGASGAVTVTTNGNVTITGATGAVNVTEIGTVGGETISILGGTDVLVTSVGHGETITIGGGDSVLGIAVYAIGGNETVSLPNVAIPASISLGVGAHLTFGDYANSSGKTVAFADSIIVGANSAVTLGAVASGSNSNVAGQIQLVVGPNSTVALGAITAPAGTNTTTETVVLLHDITGATSSGAYTITTIAGAAHNGGDQIDFGEENNQSFVSTAVDVSAATSLSNALDIAATHDTTHGANIGAFVGVLTWFQYSGNTYLVEAVNDTASAASHEGLGVSDVVVKLVGLIEIGPNPDFRGGLVI